MGVVITANTQSILTWKFEAYDSVTQAPGDIDYIVIDSGTTVGKITLSVIGQWPHTYGARDLELLNLVDYGASTNVIDEINISRNAAEDGDLEAYGADSVAIGAKLGPYDLHIFGPVTGDVTINGAGPHTGDIFVGGTSYAGDMYFGGDMDGDINFGTDFDGEIEIEGDLRGMITIARDAGSDSRITFVDVSSTGGVDIGRDFEGVIAKPDEPYAQTCQGTFHVTGDTKSGSAVTLGDLEYPGTIEIDGDCDGGINLANLDVGASIEIDGYCDGGLEFSSISGTFDVAGDFGGTLQCGGITPATKCWTIYAAA